MEHLSSAMEHQSALIIMVIKPLMIQSI
jgi:hypothetical protein